MSVVRPRQIVQSENYLRWFARLRDARARYAVESRLNRIRKGNLGDVRPVGDNVHEIRIDVGPGYRVYFTELHDIVVLLLCAGDKSTQDRDIQRAKALALAAEEIVDGTD